MKRIFIALLLASGLAHAADSPNVIAKTRNEAGGEIVFSKSSTDICRKKNMAFVYTTNDKGQVATGCWGVVDDYVMVLWDDGETRMYKLDSLTYSDWVLAGKGAKTKGATSL